nr:MAG TPA: hypothetical protein [Caudoviricetes sp.]
MGKAFNSFLGVKWFLFANNIARFAHSAGVF